MLIRNELVWSIILLCCGLISCGHDSGGGAQNRNASNIPLQSGITGTIPTNTEAGLFFWDQLGPVKYPLKQKSISVSSADSFYAYGWAVNDHRTGLAGGVELAIDGTAYQVQYGLSRQDVADAFKLAALNNCGWQVSFPAQVIAKGTHKVAIRILAPDRRSYIESPVLPVTIE